MLCLRLGEKNAKEKTPIAQISPVKVSCARLASASAPASRLPDFIGNAEKTTKRSKHWSELKCCCGRSTAWTCASKNALCACGCLYSPVQRVSDLAPLDLEITSPAPSRASSLVLLFWCFGVVACVSACTPQTKKTKFNLLKCRRRLVHTPRAVHFPQVETLDLCPIGVLANCSRHVGKIVQVFLLKPRATWKRLR